MADTNNINLFINSASKNESDTNYNLSITLQDDHVYCKENQGIRINMTSFSMINSMTNVNYTNNSFSIIFTNLNGDILSTSSGTIPDGNYSVYDFMDMMNTTWTGSFSMTYNTASNSYNILSTSTDPNIKVKLMMNTAGVFFGIPNGNIIPLSNIVPYKTSFVNMTGWNKLVLRVKGIQFEDNTIDNLRDSEFEHSEILFWVSRLDIRPFGAINYSNEDNGDTFNYKIHNKNVKNLQLTLTDENENVIYDASNYTAIIQFEVYDRENDNQLITLNSINGYLKQITTFILMLLEYVKII